MVVNIEEVKVWTSNHVYIGRGTEKIARSKWANPFYKETKDIKGKLRACQKFQEWISSNSSMEELAELEGKILVCHCKKPPCHGYILEALAREAKYQLGTKK